MLWAEPVTSASGEQEIITSAVAIKTAKRPMEPSRRLNADQTALALRFSLVLPSQKVAVPVPRNQILGEIHVSRMEAEDGSPRFRSSESRFAAYVEGFASVIGHND